MLLNSGSFPGVHWDHTCSISSTDRRLCSTSPPKRCGECLKLTITKSEEGSLIHFSGFFCEDVINHNLHCVTATGNTARVLIAVISPNFHREFHGSPVQDGFPLDPLPTAEELRGSWTGLDTPVLLLCQRCWALCTSLWLPPLESRKGVSCAFHGRAVEA